MPAEIGSSVLKELPAELLEGAVFLLLLKKVILVIDLHLGLNRAMMVKNAWDMWISPAVAKLTGLRCLPGIGDGKSTKLTSLSHSVPNLTMRPQ